MTYCSCKRCNMKEEDHLDELDSDLEGCHI